MTLKKLAVYAIIVSNFAGFAQTASAQGQIPANFPPASYTGKQFVDNDGCVFVRAGFDGNVTWVPRVTRQRKPICGQTPTMGGNVTAAATVRTPGAPPPVQITVDTPPAAAPVAATPAPVATAPRRVVRSTTATVPNYAPAPRVVMAPASKPVTAEPPRIVRPVPTTTVRTVAPASTRVVVPAREACLAGKTTRRVGNRTVSVRCGPQSAPHVTEIRRGEAPTAGKNVYYNRNSWQGSSLAPDTRIVPRHVYESRDTQIASIPAGYKPAWEDDRLNPYRAIQTVAGHQATQQIWSNQVPRRLISRANKRQPFPKNLWTTRYRHEVKAPDIAYVANQTYPPVDVQIAYAAQAPYRTDVLSTRGNAGASGGGFVEIGVFTTSDKAAAASARLAAAGFPVQAANVTHRGQSVQRLRVGPYGTDVAVKAALAAVHRSGYTQAYVR